jgi:hypothetical protein
MKPSLKSKDLLELRKLSQFDRTIVHHASLKTQGTYSATWQGSAIEFHHRIPIKCYKVEMVVCCTGRAIFSLLQRALSFISDSP